VCTEWGVRVTGWYQIRQFWSQYFEYKKTTINYYTGRIQRLSSLEWFRYRTYIKTYHFSFLSIARCNIKFQITHSRSLNIFSMKTEQKNRDSFPAIMTPWKNFFDLIIYIFLNKVFSQVSEHTYIVLQDSKGKKLTICNIP